MSSDDVTVGVSSGVTGGSSSVVSGSDSSPSPLLTIDEFMKNEIEIAQPNHQEVKTRPLSSLEQFYVRVHEVYQHQTLQKHTKEAQEAAEEKAKLGSTPAASGAVTMPWPFGSMETKIFMAKYQIDNIIAICDQLLRGSIPVRAGMPSPAAPMLTLTERNTELVDAKTREQLQADRDRLRSEREQALQTTTDPDQRAAIEAQLAKDDEETEYFQDDDGGLGESDEVLVVPDQGDATISIETRRKRLGTLLMHKRRQYAAATAVLQRGRDELARSIDGERRFLKGVAHIAQYWTLRTIQSDVNGTNVNPQVPPKGPLFNPYQNGLPAGGTSPYPSMVIDYRIGALDISLDRGKAWLYRNDAGDVFLDEAIGKEETKASKVKLESKKEEEDHTNSTDVEMSDGQPTSFVPTLPSTEPSWLTVSARLQRAQQQLLYKQLYNALMTEAREWRTMTRREQQLKGSSSSSAAAAAAAASGAASATPPFVLPPSGQSYRPWSVVEITPRQITIFVAGTYRGISINWNSGIGAGFEVTEDREGLSGIVRTETETSESAITPLMSQLLCNQTLSILLDQTLKNSLGSRPFLETLQSQGSQSTGPTDLPNPPQGVGSATLNSPEDHWPTKSPSLLQFIVMSVTHTRLVRDVRQAIHQLQMKIATQQHSMANSSTTSPPLPTFHIRPARATQPHVYAFAVMVGKRFVLDATIRGVHFHVITSLPPSQPSPVTYTIFGEATPNHTIGTQFPVAEMVSVTSATHFIDILTTVLPWYTSSAS